MKRASTIAIAFALLGRAIAACSDAGGGLSIADAGALDAARPAVIVEAGTGRDMFEHVGEGGSVELTAGPQGTGRFMGYHIWMGAQFQGFEPNGVRIQSQILDAMTRDVRAEQTRVFELEASDPGYVVFGISPRITDCCLVENKRVILRIQATDAMQVSGEDEVEVQAGDCKDAMGTRICP